MSTTTPLLSTHDDEEYHPIASLPANAYFKRPIKLLGIATAFLSLAVFGLLIAALVFTKTGPFFYTYGTEGAVRDLAIIVGFSHIII